MKSLICIATTLVMGIAVSGSVSAQGWLQRATGGRVSTPEPIRKIAPNGISMSRPNPAHTASELKPIPSSNGSRQAQGSSRGIPIVPQDTVKSDWGWVQHQQGQDEIIRSQQELINQKQALINQKQALIQQMQTQSQPQWNQPQWGQPQLNQPQWGGQPRTQPHVIGQPQFIQQQPMSEGAAIASGILQIVGAGIQAGQANRSR